ncbi:unnamed protein product [Orchesella dallaii]|uniref:Uncharacterized protein n=1 Tax=Orchesella dallaii TaxID=48710 RepID=A0ABP1S7F7_9HEXA
MILTILSLMTGIIVIGRFATLRVELVCLNEKSASLNWKSCKSKPHHYKQRYKPPTPTYSRVCSNWTLLLSGMIWLAIFCETQANAYPTVTETKEMMLASASHFKSSEIEEQEVYKYDYYRRSENSGNEDEDSKFLENILEQDAKSKKPEKRHVRAHLFPRRKVCHHFFPKYFSPAMLNDRNPDNFSGMKVGPNSEAQRGSSVRPNLPTKFYPPLVLMNSWSPAGRRSSMRLRWGK